MIRIFVTLGVVGGLLVAYLTVFAVGPISQLPPPESLLTDFRAEGIIPAEINLEENPAIEEAGVFEVPERDAIMLEMAKAASAAMDMGADGSMDMMASGSTMNMGDATMQDNANGANMDSDSAMNMSEANGSAMQDGANGTKMNMGGSDGGSMAMTDTSAPMDMGEGGLLVSEDGAFDREITLSMSEWEFSDMNITVKTGERIKFTIKNTGQIPHEFMFMSGPLMQAVKYRATRADWNLVEHEALFEQALVLPGGAFSFVLQVTQPGSWMFMCMLPYHMQMGMMGQMATKGMAMKM